MRVKTKYPCPLCRAECTCYKFKEVGGGGPTTILSYRCKKCGATFKAFGLGLEVDGEDIKIKEVLGADCVEWTKKEFNPSSREEE